MPVILHLCSLNHLVAVDGIARHPDAGHEEALQTARDKGIRIPLLEE